MPTFVIFLIHSVKTGNKVDTGKINKIWKAKYISVYPVSKYESMRNVKMNEWYPVRNNESCHVW